MAEPPHEIDEEPGVFGVEDAAALEASDQRALADFEAGRFVSHEAVKRWVASWGTDNPLPRPKCGD
jgi:predicted transcriptional regulator